VEQTCSKGLTKLQIAGRLVTSVGFELGANATLNVVVENPDYELDIYSAQRQASSVSPALFCA
jgi:hypothetical protein